MLVIKMMLCFRYAYYSQPPLFSLGICTGPKREFFVIICKDIVDKHHNLFHSTDDNQYRFVNYNLIA